MPERTTTVRTAIVTGAMSGIGAACVERFRNDGIRVISLDRSAGADAVIDVTDSASINDLAGSIGPIDILVNCAGISIGQQAMIDISDEDFDRCFRVNMYGTFYMCRAFVPGMVEKGWGRIVNVSSIGGKEGNPLSSAYSGSKAAVIGFTKSLSKEIATTGVLANCIAPTVIQTPILQGLDTAWARNRIPMERVGQPEEAAALIAFLSSDEMTFSTGFTFDLSGGRATY